MMAFRNHLPLLFFLLSFPIVAESLTTPTRSVQSRRLHTSSLLQMTQDDDHGESIQQQQRLLLESLRSLRVKELKSQLDSRGVSIRDVFEKEELVQRLYTAKICSGDGNDASDDTNSSKKKKKRRRYHDDDADDDKKNDTTIHETTNNHDDNRDDDDIRSTSVPQSTRDNIIVPFQYFSLEASKSVAAKNSQDIYIRPSDGKYAAIKVILQKTTTQSSSTLNLLVDTACSGLVISPNAVTRVNGECPGILDMQSVGATMTTAGGSQAAGVARWDKSTNMIVGGVVVSPAAANDGSMSNVAAVQDIGALPSGLDGIIGLSFLNQFSTVDFDFTSGRLCLFKKEVDPPLPSGSNNNGQLSVVAQGRLDLTRLGIYTTQTNLDGRGPVSMLVDSGAASTFLNWNGISQLNLSPDSPLVNPIAGSIGAMGEYCMILNPLFLLYSNSAPIYLTSDM